MGAFFRYYLYAIDREELQIKRAQHSWFFHAAKNIDNTFAFGSTRSLEENSSVLVVNYYFQYWKRPQPRRTR